MSDIHVLCDSKGHPIKPYLEQWIRETVSDHDNVRLLNKESEITEGDFLFLISCQNIISEEKLKKYKYRLVIHASDLPDGRGWSPHIWSILQGSNELTVSLINAEKKVDTGDVWIKKTIELNGTELYQEINQKLFSAEIELMNWAIVHCSSSQPIPQSGVATYHRKRKPEDSELNIHSPLESLIPLLRVSDDERYPAYFYYKNTKYKVKITKMS